MNDFNSRLMRVAQWRYGASWLITIVIAGVAVLFLVSLAYGLVAIVYGAFLMLSDEWGLLAVELGAIAAVILYLLLYVVPFVLTLPVSAPIIALWNSPPRALLLRPFNRGPLSRPLRRIIRRDVARYAHVYTLSDADINVPWYVRIPMLFGQLALFSFRMRAIRDVPRIAKLERATRRIWLRNINWCLALGKIFPVATSDALWHEVVDCLLRRASIVIIDVSDLRESVIWEIDRAKALGAEWRIFYLIPTELIERSHDALVRPLGPDAVANRLFRYGKDGIIERDRFHAALVDSIAIEATDTDRSPGGLAITATVAFAIGVLPLLALAFPLFNKVGLPHWSAWAPAYASSAPWPGVAAVANAGAVFVVAFGISTWLLLIFAARRAPNLWFLLIIQTLMVLATPFGMLEPSSTG